MNGGLQMERYFCRFEEDLKIHCIEMGYTKQCKPCSLLKPYETWDMSKELLYPKIRWIREI